MVSCNLWNIFTFTFSFTFIRFSYVYKFTVVLCKLAACLLELLCAARGLEHYRNLAQTLWLWRIRLWRSTHHRVSRSTGRS